MIPKAEPLHGGLVVLFEGIDGAGKTTQLKLASEALQNAGWPVLGTRNLGGTPIGEALREVMLSLFQRPPLTDLYISLAIQEALLEVIDGARNEGKVILMDRSPLSLAAYQVHGTGIDEAVGWQYVQNGMSRLRSEMVILYTADIQQAVARNRQPSNDADYFESKPISYLKRVEAGYSAAAERYALQVIDAEQPIEIVHQQSMALIAEALKRKLQDNKI